MANAEMLGRFKVYPRGFLGALLDVRVQTEAALKQDNLGFSQQRVIQFKSLNDYNSPNPNVEALYAQYIKNAGDSGSFEFRKKLLIVALHAFGTPRFDVWYQAQLQSPLCGDLHRRFLDDTLHFIREGRREMSLETWNSLLDANDAGDHSAALSEYANEFFGLSSNGYNRYPKNQSKIEVIQAWCSQPNGLEDLLGTLHVLFGVR